MMGQQYPHNMLFLLSADRKTEVELYCSLLKNVKLTLFGIVYAYMFIGKVLVSSLETWNMGMFPSMWLSSWLLKTPHFTTCVQLVIQKASGWFWNNCTILGDETNLEDFMKEIGFNQALGGEEN